MFMIKENDSWKPSTSIAVWIATALLHKENPTREGFQGKEIFKKVKELNILRTLDSTLRTHITHHCVANANPYPNKDRKLFRLGNGFYRLYKEGDMVHPGRENGESFPDISKIAPQFQNLIHWYLGEYSSTKISVSGVEMLTGEVFSSIIKEDNSVIMPEGVLKHLNANNGDMLVFFRLDKEGILIKKPTSR